MNWIKDFKGFPRGFHAPLEGWRYLNQHPSLWQYAGWPILINLVLTFVILAVAFYASSFYGGWTQPLFGTGFWWNVLQSITDFLAVILGIVMTIGVVVVSWMFFSAIFCSYFYAILARQVEIQLGLDKERITEVSVTGQVSDGLRTLGSIIFFNIIFLFLHFIPLLGSFLYLIVSTYFNSLVFGNEYFSYALDLRGLRRRDKNQYVKKHRGEALGLGFSVLCMSLIPVVGAIGMTTAAVGAVLLNRKITV